MRLILTLCLLLWSPVAHAEWLQASSEHFVVYADDSERDIRRFSDRLERYHAAMALITTAKLETPSPSNRVTVYVVSNVRQVRELYGEGEGSKYIGGFYKPRAGGSLAIVPRVDSSGSEPAFSMIVLLHEYAHHFLISSSSFPMPRWLGEGTAEFMAAASFGSDGGVEIGKPANHRAAELLLPGFARDVAVADLIDPTTYDKRQSKAYDAFYGKSWLLYHYLTFDDSRAGQLGRYLSLMAAGKSSRDAGLEAFGDFAKLEKDLDHYLKARRMIMLKIPPNRLTPGPVTVRRLSAGEAAMMPVRIRSRLGVDAEQAKALLPEARTVAARYPDDPAVLAALAEAEHDAGNNKESIVAANAAIIKDPSQVNAFLQKALSLLSLAEEAKPDEEAAAYRKARSAFIDLNRLENNHPLPLFYNYEILLKQGKQPDDLALRGLERAAELAPFDLGLRMTLALQQLRFGHRDDARSNLKPIAYNPHGGGLAKVAQQALARIDSDPKWDGSGVPDVAAIDDADAGSDQGPTAK